MIITKQGVRTNSALLIIYLEKIKLLSKPVFKNFISNKVQNDVWIAVFMQLFLRDFAFIQKKQGIKLENAKDDLK